MLMASSALTYIIVCNEDVAESWGVDYFDGLPFTPCLYYSLIKVHLNQLLNHASIDGVWRAGQSPQNRKR